MATAALTPKQIATYAYEAGFRGQSLTTAVAISLAESRGVPNAIGDVNLETGTWGPSVGLWQIRSLWNETGTGGQRDREANLNPLTNARHAYQISGDGTDFQPWSTYTYGQYRSYLGPAAVAARAVTADPPGSSRASKSHTHHVATSGTGHHASSHHASTTKKATKVEVVDAEMTALESLLHQGHTDITQHQPLAERAVRELQQAADLPTVGGDAAAMVPLAAELVGLLAQLATGLATSRKLVAATHHKAKKADDGFVPPAVAKLLPPALVSQLDHGSSPRTAKVGAAKGAHHSGSTSGAGTTTHTHTASSTSSARPTLRAEEQKVVHAAEKFLGVPYVYGGDSSSGVDCSGLTHLAYLNAFGKDIGRDTSAQLASGRTVGKDGDWALDRKLLQPGDLIFYGRAGASGPNAHVVMYIGGGRVIQAPYTGQRVQTGPLFESASADEPFLGVRRYLPVPSRSGTRAA